MQWDLMVLRYALSTCIKVENIENEIDLFFILICFFSVVCVCIAGTFKKTLLNSKRGEGMKTATRQSAVGI